jgi:hypothetical protein
MTNARLNLYELIEAASVRALVQLSENEKAEMARIVEEIAATFERHLDQGQMVEDISNYPLGDDPLLATSLNPELIGMQIRHTESSHWVPNHDVLIRGFLDVVLKLKESGRDFPACAKACTVYTLIAYALRRQISN